MVGGLDGVLLLAQPPSDLGKALPAYGVGQNDLGVLLPYGGAEVGGQSLVAGVGGDVSVGVGQEGQGIGVVLSVCGKADG